MADDLSPRKRSLLGELTALRPAGGAGSASALFFLAPPAVEAAFGGEDGQRHSWRRPEVG